MHTFKKLGMAAIIATIGFSGLALADTTALKSKTGQAIGLQISDYKYEEPSLMDNKGTKFGITYEGTYNFGNDWFWGGDFRYSKGDVDYTGSGTLNNANDRAWEARVIGGKDYDMNGYVLSPYVGLGYRDLFNDLRGTTSTGAVGYRRYSEYVYLPLGVTHRFGLANSARLSTSLEYDYLIQGKQRTKLEDVGMGYDNLTNKQKSGYGLRVSSAYETNQWSAGVFYNYWNIDQSESETVYQGGVAVGTGWEPKNTTHEVGFQGKLRF